MNGGSLFPIDDDVQLPAVPYELQECPDGCCLWCPVVLDHETYQQDHVIPRSAGGTITKPTCASCNHLKSDTLPIEFIRQRARKLNQIIVSGCRVLVPLARQFELHQWLNNVERLSPQQLTALQSACFSRLYEIAEQLRKPLCKFLWLNRFAEVCMTQFNSTIVNVDGCYGLPLRRVMDYNMPQEYLAYYLCPFVSHCVFGSRSYEGSVFSSHLQRHADSYLRGLEFAEYLTHMEVGSKAPPDVPVQIRISCECDDLWLERRIAKRQVGNEAPLLLDTADDDVATWRKRSVDWNAVCALEEEYRDESLSKLMDRLCNDATEECE